MSPILPGITKPDLQPSQKVADGLREMAARQGDPLVASMMEIGADRIELGLDLIAALHGELAALVDAAGKAGEQ